MANFFCIQHTSLYLQSRENEFLPLIHYTTQDIKDILLGQYYYFFAQAQQDFNFSKPACLSVKENQPLEFKRILKSVNQNHITVMLSKTDKKICEQIYLHLLLPCHEIENDFKIAKI